MNRRRFIALAGASGPLGLSALTAALAPVSRAVAGDRATVDFAAIEARAAQVAQREHQQKRLDLPGRYAELTYDDLRRIRPRTDQALWLGEDRGFVVDRLHPGFLFHDAVRMNLIEDGVVAPLPFDPALFDYDGAAPPDPEGLTYSGFRMRYPINAPDILDEVAVFQGASYFRAVGRSDFYGLSARGLALDVAGPDGEEFPYFSEFWLERPRIGAESATIYALLESPSVAGAYAFEITPGDETVIDVRATLYPRRQLDGVGIAPLTSMFLFDPSDRIGFDDFRGAVHDSNGLQILTGYGERIWRPLANPRRLQISAFLDKGPKGFGLAQRARDFAYYQDAEAAYERRTSAWIEPQGDWGPGAVTLVEIPVKSEIHDNIVAFWRPAAPLSAGGPHRFAYRMRWAGRAGEPDGLAKVVGTRAGRAPNDGIRRFVIDFEGAPTALDQAQLRVSASTGEIAHPTLSPLPQPGRYRAAFAFTPDDDRTSEFRLQLVNATGVCSETWLYRWTAS